MTGPATGCQDCSCGHRWPGLEGALELAGPGALASPDASGTVTGSWEGSSQMTSSEAWRRSWALAHPPAETPEVQRLGQGAASLPAPQDCLGQNQGCPSCCKECRSLFPHVGGNGSRAELTRSAGHWPTAPVHEAGQPMSGWPVR